MVLEGPWPDKRSFLKVLSSKFVDCPLNCHKNDLSQWKVSQEVWIQAFAAFGVGLPRGPTD